MKVVAVVMAGGRGTRLTADEEKPIVKCRNKAMIDYVLNALKNCSSVSETLVAVSPYTPRTEGHVKTRGFKIIKTSGVDYVSDVRSVVKSIGKGIVLVIGADLPLITSRIIDEVVERFKHSKKPTMCVNYTSKSTAVPVGLNLFRAERIADGPLAEEVFESPDESLAVNVNTLEDLTKAEALLKDRPKA